MGTVTKRTYAFMSHTASAATAAASSRVSFRAMEYAFSVVMILDAMILASFLLFALLALAVQNRALLAVLALLGAILLERLPLQKPEKRMRAQL